MNWIKNKWQRFTRWQQQSPDYTTTNAAVECLNCGTSYRGNYCPMCGQSAKVSRISIHKVMRGAMDVWGLGNNLLLKNVGHLLFRPGYLIADYLHGRRQTYFPPFKTLFLLAALNLLLEHMAGTNDLFTAEDAPQEVAESLNSIFHTINDYQAFLWIGIALVMACLARVFFRFSPRLGRINLGECIFVQVWMSNQFLIADIIDSTLDLTLGMSFNDVLLPLPFIFIAYKQLFGFGWWGTLWRTVAVVTLVLSFIMLLFMSLMFYYGM